MFDRNSRKESDAMSKLTKSMLLLLGAAGGAVAAEVSRSSNVGAVQQTFRKWAAGEGSLEDLMAEDAVIHIPGTASHCGIFSRTAFTRDVARPFIARFSQPPRPRARMVSANRNDVVVLADSEGMRRDGKPYANCYVFVLKMRRGRVVRATEFLDMVAFNEVWDQVAPIPAAIAGDRGTLVKRWVIDRHGRDTLRIDDAQVSAPVAGEVLVRGDGGAGAGAARHGEGRAGDFAAIAGRKLRFGDRQSIRGFGSTPRLSSSSRLIRRCRTSACRSGTERLIPS